MEIYHHEIYELSSVFPGVNTMANYEQVLHLVRYKNWHTEALFDRKFKLVCSELNGRYISNDFKVEVWLTICQLSHVTAMHSQHRTATPCLCVTEAFLCHLIVLKSKIVRWQEFVAFFCSMYVFFIL